MLNVLRSEFAEIDASRKALRSFGLTVGTVLLVIAAVVLWRSGWSPGLMVYIIATTGALLILFGAATPPVLRPVHLLWMGLALALGFVMTRVLLTVVFFLAITPTALIRRLMGKDPLQRKIDSEATTYWTPKVYDNSGPSRLEKYY